MNPSSESADRLTATLAARLALTLTRPFGLGPAQLALDALVAALVRRHPQRFERLGELGAASLLVDPADLPVLVVMELGERLRLRLIPRAATGAGPALPVAVAATIRGRFAVLLDLFEGRIDGDALFFNRQLAFEGDTALVVGLRNAIDGAGFDLRTDLLALLPPVPARVPQPVRRHLEEVGNALVTAAGDLSRLVLLPALVRLDQVDRRLARLEQRRQDSHGL